MGQRKGDDRAGGHAAVDLGAGVAEHFLEGAGGELAFVEKLAGDFVEEAGLEAGRAADGGGVEHGDGGDDAGDDGDGSGPALPEAEADENAGDEGGVGAGHPAGAGEVGEVKVAGADVSSGNVDFVLEESFTGKKNEKSTKKPSA